MFLFFINIISRQCNTLQYFTCKCWYSCNCIRICDNLGRWQRKLILLVDVIHTSCYTHFLQGILPVLLCYMQRCAVGALICLWGKASSTISSLGTRYVRIYSISAGLFTESWVNAFQEYMMNGQQAGELLEFYLFIYWEQYYWMRAIWMIGYALLYACLSVYSGVLSEFYYSSSGVSKNPFAVMRAVFVLSFFHVPKWSGS